MLQTPKYHVIHTGCSFLEVGATYCKVAFCLDVKKKVNQPTLLSLDMASAPPMETGGFVGLPQPPSYEESVGPQYQGTVLPPAYTKSAQYPYPTQPYSQIYQPTAHSTTSPMVSVQTIYVQPGVVFGDLPVQTHCPACAQMVITRLEHTSGTMAWLTCAGLFIFGCIYGCCLLPFCVDGLKDVTHRCPNCNNVLGEHKRL